MYRVKNRRVLNRIADKTRKAAKGRNLIAVFAIALTTVLFTSVFTIGGSIAAKQQEATMRQIGGSAHAGYKYLTREEYERVKKDKKIREISCRIAVGDAVNQELLKLRTNVYHDIRYYGLLKTIGTTERQLRKIVRRQAYMLSAFGISIGLILGILVGKILLPVVMSTLAFAGTTDTEAELNVWIFAGSAAFSFVTVLLSCIRPCRIASRVSEVEAVRYTEGQNEKQVKRQKKTKKIKRVSLREMALQNIKRDRKKVVIVVGSLSLALVILNIVYSLVRGFDMDKFVASRIVSDFSVADATLDNPSVDVRAVVKDGVTEEFQKELQKRERIFGNERVRKTLEWKAGSEDTELIERLREARHIDGKLYGIGKMVMGKLEKTEGTPDWEKFSSGDYVIVTGFETLEEESVDFFLPGEKVTITDRDGKVHEYEVLAAADLPYSCEFRNYGMFDCNYILPEDEFLNLVGEQGAMRTIFDVKEGYEAETEEWLADYCESLNPDLCYTSKSTIVKEFEQLKRTYAAAGSFMTLVLAVIGILNFINTMVTSVLSGKREFAMLEAVGMSGTQLRWMLAGKADIIQDLPVSVRWRLAVCSV